MSEPSQKPPPEPLEALRATELGGSWIVLVEGLAGVPGIEDLAASFGSEDLGFRRRWDWVPRADGSGIGAAVLQIEFGAGSRRWHLAVHFGTEWSPPAMVAMASGQLFSLADADRPPPPLGTETELLLPLMLDIDPDFLGAAGELVGGTLELALCVHRFEDERQALGASDRAVAAMGELGFMWRLAEASPSGGSPAGFVCVAVAFSRAGAEQADAAMYESGGVLTVPEGPLGQAIEARLWPGVEEGAAEAAGDERRGRRGGLILTDGGFEHFGPK